MECQRLFQTQQRSQPARVRSGSQTVRDLHPASQCDRRAAPGARHVRLDGRPDDPLSPHERHPDPVGAGDRSRRDRHPAAGGKIAGQRGPDPGGNRAGGLPGAHLGLEEKIWRDYHPADPAAGSLLRLGPGALHPGRWPVGRRAGSLRAPVRKGPDLPRPAPDQLVARFKNRGIRPGSGVFGRTR